MKLTDFQLKCEGSLVDFLECMNLSISQRDVIGNGEIYIHLSIENRDLEVWIYDDEVEYRLGRRQKNFEAAAFPSEADRIAAFLKGLQAHL